MQKNYVFKFKITLVISMDIVKIFHMKGNYVKSRTPSIPSCLSSPISFKRLHFWTHDKTDF